MKYSDLQGDVTAAGHESWIELNSFEWGLNRDISSPTGGSADRESDAPTVNMISVTKPTDIATVKLLDEALEGEGQDVTIDFCKTDKGNLSVYLSFVLNNTMISDYRTTSGGDRPNESYSLNFTKFQMKGIPSDAAAKAGSPAVVTYDIGLGHIV
jgi:type VI secretion system secreted protein Hcp